MLKALLKKQFLQTASFFFMKGAKKGKRRNALGIIGVMALMVYAIGAGVFMFWKMSSMLCEPFVQGGLSWVYFAFMGILATGLGCIGSIFAAKTALYEAKDNELLLSMPIPSWMILLSRLIGLYLMTLFFVAIVWITSVVCYLTVAGFSFLSCLFGLLILLILPLGILAIASLLGWLIAAVTSRITAKNLLTTILLMGFFLGYSLLMSKITDLLTYVMANGEQLGDNIKVWLFPFWQLGLAAMGKPWNMLLFTLFSLGIFAVAYLLLSATFVAIVTRKRTAKKAVYVERERKVSSPLWALTKKEFKRYTKNPMILFNCGLGSILAIVFAVYGLVDTELCMQIVTSGFPKADVILILTTIMCFIATSNVITGSAISLEGDNLWVLRAMPISTSTIFKAKILFHLIYTIVPTFIAQVILCALLEIPVGLVALSLLLYMCVAYFCAVMGLVVNLKLPNLKWTNEIVAVKQSFSVLITMFAGWGASAIVLGGSFLLDEWLSPVPYLLLVTALFIVASIAVSVWLKKRGQDVFEKL